MPSGERPSPGGRVAVGDDGAPRYLGGGATAADGSLRTTPGFFALRGDAASPRFEALPAPGLGSYLGALVHDARRDRWLSVCGADTTFVGVHCLAHAYTEAEGWRRVAVLEGPAPSGRFGFHYAHDAASDRIIVFGGQTGSGNLDLDAETWALELAPEGAEAGAVAWARLETPPEVLPRRNGAFAYDPEGRRMFVWGGTPDGRRSVSGLDVLSLERGRERWIHLEIDGAPPPRTSGQGLHDAAGRRILWGFGNDAEIYTDLWALDLDPRGGV